MVFWFVDCPIECRDITIDLGMLRQVLIPHKAVDSSLSLCRGGLGTKIDCMRGGCQEVKGAGLRTLSRRCSRVRLPSPAFLLPGDSVFWTGPFFGSIQPITF